MNFLYSNKMHNYMNKLPGTTKTYDLKSIMDTATTNTWYIDPDDLSYAFKLSNFKEVIAESPEKTVERSATKLGIKDDLEQIFFEWPFLVEPTQNLAAYFTLFFPSESGVPLFDVCLKSAVEMYTTAKEKSFSEPDGEDHVVLVQAYVTGLSNNIHEILGHNIFGLVEDKGWECWRTLSSPVSKWLRSSDFQQLLIVPNTIISKEEALLSRVHLVHQIFSYHFLKTIKFDWEKIIKQQVFR